MTTINGAIRNNKTQKQTEKILRKNSELLTIPEIFRKIYCSYSTSEAGEHTKINTVRYVIPYPISLLTKEFGSDCGSRMVFVQVEVVTSGDGLQFLIYTHSYLLVCFHALLLSSCV